MSNILISDISLDCWKIFFGWAWDNVSFGDTQFLDLGNFVAPPVKLGRSRNHHVFGTGMVVGARTG
jgi:hypothetical protein